jgi:hypothetical protein
LLGGHVRFGDVEQLGAAVTRCKSISSRKAAISRRIFVVAHDNVRIVSDFSQANQIVETEALCG